MTPGSTSHHSAYFLDSFCLGYVVMFTWYICPYSSYQCPNNLCSNPNRYGWYRIKLNSNKSPKKVWSMSIFFGVYFTFCDKGINTLRPRQNGRRFADDTFKHIFLNKNVRISIKISLKFVPKGPINNNPALVQIMAWRRLGDKPLSEPMMDSLPTHICVTRPQWINTMPLTGRQEKWYSWLLLTSE